MKQMHILNIPILPEAFLTFASKRSIGPSREASESPDLGQCRPL